jgi:hypothetical protein
VSPDGSSREILATDKGIAAAGECGKMCLYNQQEMLEIRFPEK